LNEKVALYHRIEVPEPISRDITAGRSSALVYGEVTDTYTLLLFPNKSLPTGPCCGSCTCKDFKTTKKAALAAVVTTNEKCSTTTLSDFPHWCKHLIAWVANYVRCSARADAEYELSAIRGQRYASNEVAGGKMEGGWEYLCGWVGLPRSRDSWEPWESLKDTDLVGLGD
jgi:hypothetical protein